MGNILRIIADRKNRVRGVVEFGVKRFACALGKSGIINEAKKREGDGATPAGLYFPVCVYLRRDRVQSLQTLIPKNEILENSGWCYGPECQDYNTHVTLPHTGSAEKLWRQDGLYDIILVISHNQAPVVPGKGSAIFFHIATDDFLPTEGCVALRKDDLPKLLEAIRPATLIRIHS